MQNIVGLSKLSFVIASELQYNLDLLIVDMIIKTAERERERERLKLRDKVL